MEKSKKEWVDRKKNYVRVRYQNSFSMTITSTEFWSFSMS
ncbi:Protein CBG27333 [Caenorhabditis briggsae]|uniref:Protein CBG27333 n=1 Tax=Caenorhabditis briggsae TaxID=6238 RepID=B6IG65_CAEBR|nr:Protein CBG27333 [Caenorhabditis briggsae]CAR98895.1 Protein CBG27333 [Caenorhabditis briggsae]